jgi:hypothetical protein
LWQVIENKNIHVLDSSIYYREILEFMESAVEDTDSFMSGKSFLSFCNRQTIVNDTIFQSLTDSTEHDNVVSAILRVILPGICQLLGGYFQTI